MAMVLRKVWEPIFGSKKVSGDAVAKLLNFKPKGVVWDWSGVRPNSGEMILKQLGRSANSKPGPDGIPYSAWLAAGLKGADMLANLSESLCQGCPPPG
eukprot:5282312-Karenia_brevis.AAC.1